MPETRINSAVRTEKKRGSKASGRGSLTTVREQGDCSTKVEGERRKKRRAGGGIRAGNPSGRRSGSRFEFKSQEEYPRVTGARGKYGSSCDVAHRILTRIRWLAGSLPRSSVHGYPDPGGWTGNCRERGAWWAHVRQTVRHVGRVSIVRQVEKSDKVTDRCGSTHTTPVSRCLMRSAAIRASRSTW